MFFFVSGGCENHSALGYIIFWVVDVGNYYFEFHQMVHLCIGLSCTSNTLYSSVDKIETYSSTKCLATALETKML